MGLGDEKVNEDCPQNDTINKKTLLYESTYIDETIATRPGTSETKFSDTSSISDTKSMATLRSTKSFADSLRDFFTRSSKKSHSEIMDDHEISYDETEQDPIPNYNFKLTNMTDAHNSESLLQTGNTRVVLTPAFVHIVSNYELTSISDTQIEAYKLVEKEKGIQAEFSSIWNICIRGKSQVKKRFVKKIWNEGQLTKLKEEPQKSDLIHC
ncbi:unnamed protein product [Ambrosiozyma monospora]|uniref:Unnamed protein product n=1 Tax=Ambrosiozyma monospora TaxID=43982 RepID=A0A9W6T9H9_AMBMO|nr:unnamed protein product [Ambrosiozyma monospora]